MNITLTRWLAGNNGGLLTSDIDVKRDRFSTLFPYVSYDPDTQHYYLRDNSAGWVWECTPILFADDNIFNTISSILRYDVPHHTVFQFMLYADPYIHAELHDYERQRENNPLLSDLHRDVTTSYASFLKDGLRGMWQLSGTPLRNYRLFLSLKVPIKADIAKSSDSYINEIGKYKDTVKSITESLKVLNPRLLNPSDMITMFYRICNPELDPDKQIEWDENVPLHKQIIYSDTEIERLKSSIKIGDKYIGIITPKKLPRNISNMFTNDIVGFISRGATAIENDINQVQAPYIYSVNIITDKNLRSRLSAKAIHNSRASQGASKDGNLDSMMVSTGNRRDENMYVANQYEEGNTFLHVIPEMMIFADSEDDLTAKQSRVKSFWNACGVESQTELDYLLHVLFIAALPLGLYQKNIGDLERDFIMDTNAAAMLAPVQASFGGIGKPILMYIDRRGQLVGIDIFKTGKNKNFFVTGGTGAGKSFSMNDFVNSYMGIGAKFRIITVCDSYRKTTYLTDGQYIEHEEAGMVINFFEEAGTKTGMLTHDVSTDRIDLYAGDFVEIADEAEAYCKIIVSRNGADEVLIIPAQPFENITYKLDGDTLNMLTGIIASMTTSRSGDKLDEDELTILETAIEKAYREKKRETTIDDVEHCLMAFDKYLDESERAKFHINTAFRLGVRLEKYTSKGQYGKFFNGKNTVSFKKDLVVVDLTKTPDDLKKVFVLAFANIIEQEIYKGDRVTPQFVVLDESWQTLSENPYARRFVEGLYRKARKYNASVGIVTQSLADLAKDGKLGALGDVIRSQSDFSFALYDNNFGMAYETGILDISPFEYQTLVAKIPADSLPRYSEIFVRTPHGNTIVRLIVDEYKYFINTSDPDDYVFIRRQAEKFLEKGLSKTAAMKEAVRFCAELAKKQGGIGGYKKYLADHRQESK